MKIKIKASISASVRPVDFVALSRIFAYLDKFNIVQTLGRDSVDDPSLYVKLGNRLTLKDIAHIGRILQQTEVEHGGHEEDENYYAFSAKECGLNVYVNDFGDSFKSVTIAPYTASWNATGGKEIIQLSSWV